jgi:hypothetical protein
VAYARPRLEDLMTRRKIANLEIVDGRTIIDNVKSPLRLSKLPPQLTDSVSVIICGPLDDADARKLSQYLGQFKNVMLGIGPEPTSGYTLQFLKHFPSLQTFFLMDQEFECEAELIHLPQAWFLSNRAVRPAPTVCLERRYTCLRPNGSQGARRRSGSLRRNPSPRQRRSQLTASSETLSFHRMRVNGRVRRTIRREAASSCSCTPMTAGGISRRSRVEASLLCANQPTKAMELSPCFKISTVTCRTCCSLRTEHLSGCAAVTSALAFLEPGRWMVSAVCRPRGNCALRVRQRRPIR